MSPDAIRPLIQKIRSRDGSFVALCSDECDVLSAYIEAIEQDNRFFRAPFMRTQTNLTTQTPCTLYPTGRPGGST